MFPWQAIVFDLDDTLYAERDYVLSGFRAVAKWSAINLGIPQEQGYAALYQLYTSGVRGDTFNRWLHLFGMNEKYVPALVQVYREHEPHLRPFPEIPPLLAELHRQYRLGLLSDGFLEVQKRKLAALGLAASFDAILFTDELGREHWKPSPKPFREILLRLGMEEPNRAVYVADNPLKDFIGARETGMYTIWVRRAGGEYDHREPPTEAHRPHEMVQSIAELPRLLAAC